VKLSKTLTKLVQITLQNSFPKVANQEIKIAKNNVKKKITAHDSCLD
jgi:hypothetical protein